jgi:hypothetical protein
MKIQFVILMVSLLILSLAAAQDTPLKINELEYFENPGVNVMAFHDFYPEGHQGAITIVQNGIRVAANGDIRLEPAPGQWQPVPKMDQRTVDREKGIISVLLSYPDPQKDGKGFNPIVYPDLHFQYKVRVEAAGPSSVRIHVDLEESLPAEWIGKVGFNLELFPEHLFGKSYAMDGKVGIFPRQLNGPMVDGTTNRFEVSPMAEGKRLAIAPEVDAQRIIIETRNGLLQLLDGRAHHNNGWFIVRTPVPEGAAENAIEWKLDINALPNWTYTPVIQVSQVGYRPRHPKVAVIECDARHTTPHQAELKRIRPSGEMETVLSQVPKNWGRFLRYQYFTFDFTSTKEPGMYLITYGENRSVPFQIGDTVYDRHVWQPTLEYFLPVQMCHMRVNDRYRVWHGLCHMDDALMAPVNTHHFDGYLQGPDTLSPYRGMQAVPGLNAGGWHDAGDYDLRVESQAGTVWTLSVAFEAFHPYYDETTIDQEKRIVELHQPDGKPDILQQVEHGVLTILGGYRSLGRLYRGIICPTIRQYVLLGDGSAMTDNLVYDPKLAQGEVSNGNSGTRDDRWVFTEENPDRAIQVVSGLAAASRVLKDYNDDLATECLKTAEALWNSNHEKVLRPGNKVQALSELILATGNEAFKNELVSYLPEIQKNFRSGGWAVGRLKSRIENDQFWAQISEAVKSHVESTDGLTKRNPYGIPYRPQIWGPGWNIQKFGLECYFLHQGWPDLVSSEYMLNALNFVLGVHPGENTASYASGVGARSLTTAYGTNRGDWSYIPGGVVSGTGLIRPDLPELKHWPFFWQQSEYVIGGGASNFMFLVLAARQVEGRD